MKRVIATVSVLGLSMFSLLAADPTPKAGDAKDKPAETSTKKEKKAAPAAPAADKKKEEAKPGESAADKELLAHAAKSSATLTEPQKAKLLDIANTGDDKALEAIPGVGDKKAANIKAARPLKTVDDLILVKGIGEKTFDGIVKWAAGDFKAEEKPAKEEKKPAAKPEAPKGGKKAA
ncbi:helix-hairpin-helix domain-containing protein [Luteolibacter ambystomatis]|uniref:Helix-hairpin-helix domain-containing protein n=1 Tax=Luteolibacter ambystomatis TaxID=2824561 RepID=A0A975G6H7_9BACT|nr:helix-hairpin-helix domain-containing protein [Luteolibacter ambystomatis]QUE49688.1 helix-hairpin-helix domain-containing protein [Luteolibacter ambystomatis]